ncbi:uncharacterized protein LOC111368314 [Olea europaea var. sylvestris]|uniref:uncharacterized protein LOC111368314 n=1 Tax=Olea europaea var. sylvestris TaxID=158386 RepID=UPI000C1D2B60|nr:uncharacterized protein LOC111368314 [Olea europaea var. sylvestris]
MPGECRDCDMDQKMMNFGNITLRVAPQGSNFRFRGNNLERLPEKEHCLLDNLWMIRNSKQKLDSINALTNHFRQIHNQVESKNFSSFAVIKVRILEIYNYWPEVLQQVERFLDPLFKGFYTLEEVLSFYREMIGFNFHISERIRQAMQTPSQASSSSSSIQFCENCETMTKVVRNLNLRKHSLEKKLQLLEDQISSSQQIISKYQN